MALPRKKHSDYSASFHVPYFAYSNNKHTLKLKVIIRFS